MEQINKLTVKNIIIEARKFKKLYGNPSQGVPEPQDFNFYVLGRVDQLHDKQDENFKLILEKMDKVYGKINSISKDFTKDTRTRVSKKVFWKVNALMFTLIIFILGLVKFG